MPLPSGFVLDGETKEKTSSLPQGFILDNAGDAQNLGKTGKKGTVFGEVTKGREPGVEELGPMDLLGQGVRRVLRVPGQLLYNQDQFPDNQPILPAEGVEQLVPEFLKKQMVQGMARGIPLLRGEGVLNVFKSVTPDEDAHIRGAGHGFLKSLEGMVTPENIGLAATAPLAGPIGLSEEALGKGLLSYFFPQVVAQQLPQTLGQASVNYPTATPEQKGAMGGQISGDVLMAALMGHGLGRQPMEPKSGITPEMMTTGSADLTQGRIPPERQLDFPTRSRATRERVANQTPPLPPEYPSFYIGREGLIPSDKMTPEMRMQQAGPLPPERQLPLNVPPPPKIQARMQQALEEQQRQQEGPKTPIVAGSPTRFEHYIQDYRYIPKEFEERPPLVGQRPLTIEQPVIEKPGIGEPRDETETGKYSFKGKFVPGSKIEPTERKYYSGMGSSIDDLRPAVEFMGRLLVGMKGDTHADVLKRNGINPDLIPHEDKRRGFVNVNAPKEFLNRTQAQEQAKVVGTAKAGGLDSTDLIGKGQENANRQSPTSQLPQEKSSRDLQTMESQVREGQVQGEGEGKTPRAYAGRGIDDTQTYYSGGVNSEDLKKAVKAGMNYVMGGHTDDMHPSVPKFLYRITKDKTAEEITDQYDLAKGVTELGENHYWMKPDGKLVKGEVSEATHYLSAKKILGEDVIDPEASDLRDVYKKMRGKGYARVLEQDDKVFVKGSASDGQIEAAKRLAEKGGKELWVGDEKVETKREEGTAYYSGLGSIPKYGNTDMPDPEKVHERTLEYFGVPKLEMGKAVRTSLSTFLEQAEKITQTVPQLRTLIKEMQDSDWLKNSTLYYQGTHPEYRYHGYVESQKTPYKAMVNIPIRAAEGSTGNTMTYLSPSSFITTTLHELIHTATVAKVRDFYYNEGKNLTPQGRVAIRELETLYRHVLNGTSIDKSLYGLKNLDEFLAEGFTSLKFQNELKKIEYSTGITLWHKFVNKLKGLLGFSKDTALAHLLEQGARLMDSGGENRVPLAKTRSNTLDIPHRSQEVTITQYKVNEDYMGTKYHSGVPIVDNVKDIVEHIFGHSVNRHMSETMKYYANQAKGVSVPHTSAANEMVANKLVRAAAADVALGVAKADAVTTRAYKKRVNTELYEAYIDSKLGEKWVKGATPPATMRYTKLGEKRMWLRKDLVPELEKIFDPKQRMEDSSLAHYLLNFITDVQLIGPTDMLFHTANMLASMSYSLGKGSDFNDVMLNLPGIGTVDAITRVGTEWHRMMVNDPQVQRELVGLAKIGALRGVDTVKPTNFFGWSNRFIQKVDRAGRLARNKMWDNLVERELVKDTEQGRREFINKMGQYNDKLMGKAQTMFKGNLSPFIVAGRTFNRNAMHNLLMTNPGEGLNPTAAMKMKALNFVNLSTAMLVAPVVLNSMITGKPFGRPGTDIGAIDTGKNDKDGRPISIDLLQLTLLRRGLRISGVQGLLRGLDQGKGAKTTVEDMAKDVIAGIVHPWAGPPVRAGFTLLTGMSPEGYPMAKDTSDLGSKAKAAMTQVNPILAGLKEGQETKEGSFLHLLQRYGSLAGYKTGKYPTHEDLLEQETGKPVADMGIGERILTEQKHDQKQKEERSAKSLETRNMEEIQAGQKAIKNNIKRGYELQKELDKPDYQWLESRGLKLPGIDNKVTLAKQKVYLNESEMNRYTGLIKENITFSMKVLRKEYDGLENYKDKQEFFEGMIGAAKKAAKEQLEEEMFQKKVPKNKKKRFSIFEQEPDPSDELAEPKE